MTILLIATHNPAKKKELKEGFLRMIGNKDLCSLLFLNDLQITADPEETGVTFEENAKLKAEYFANLSSLPTVADDGGIEIDALGGEPGVKSSRWLGKKVPDQDLIDYTLLRLKNIPLGNRTARFRLALHYHNPLSKKSFHVSSSIEGTIATHASLHRVKGFPYRALFVVSRFNKLYEDLNPEEYAKVGHRLQAMQKLAPFIQKDLLQ